MKLTTAAAALAVLVATVCAVMPLTTTYAAGPMPWLLCAAAAGGASVTGLLRTRWPAASALLGSLLTLCAGVVALGTWLPRPEGSLPTAAAEALMNSGARILTSVVPVPSTMETVALPVCATWLAAAAGVTLLVSRRPASAGLPPVLLFPGSLAVVGPTSAPSYGYAAGLVVTLALLLALVARPRAATGNEPPAPGRLTTVSAAVLALVLGGATVSLSPLLAGPARPPDLRAHIVPPFENPQRINPLSMLSGWAAQPDHPLLEVTTDRPTRLRWVTLPEFTGVTWLPAQAYRSAGALLPDMVNAGPTQVRQNVDVTGLTGGWLPVPDGASEVHGVRVAVDVGSDTLAAPDGLTTGVHYTVVAAPPRWQADELATARLPADPAYDPYRSLPAGGPGRLYEVAHEAAGTGSPYQQAKALEGYLRRQYGFDAQALGGNGYPSIDRFLFQPAELGGGRGTSEQFACAFAMLARTLGIPARVVVGFGPGTPMGPANDGRPGGAVRRYKITAADAMAWPEIYLDGQGWVPFDPTPTESTIDAAGLSPVAPATTPLPTSQPAPPDETDPLANHPVDKPVESAGPAIADRIGSGLAAAGIAVLSVLLLLAAIRWWRGAARLRRGRPVDRVLGAWTELRTALRLAGAPPAAALAVDEVAGLATSTLDDPTHGKGWRERAGDLARTVNAAGFGPATVVVSDADRAAADVRALRRALWRHTTLRRRLTWPVDPRPLWWR